MSKSVKSEVMTITPEVAKGMLCHNRGNRNFRETKIADYAEIMRNGKWHLTHQGIAFDIDGRLIDGQHRLVAVIRSGATVEMMVSRDLDPSTFAFIDQGTKRTPADLLGTSTDVAQVINVATQIFFSKSKPDPENLGIMHRAIGKYAEEIQMRCPYKAAYFSSAPMRIAAILRIIQGEDKEFVLGMYEKLCRNDLVDMPPSAQNIVKLRLRNEVTSTDKQETLARGLHVFTKARSNSVRARVIDKTGAYDTLRQTLTPLFEASK